MARNPIDSSSFRGPAAWCLPVRRKGTVGKVQFEVLRRSCRYLFTRPDHHYITMSGAYPYRVSKHLGTQLRMVQVENKSAK